MLKLSSWLGASTADTVAQLDQIVTRGRSLAHTAYELHSDVWADLSYNPRFDRYRVEIGMTDMSVMYVSTHRDLVDAVGEAIDQATELIEAGHDNAGVLHEFVDDLAMVVAGEWPEVA